MSETMSAEICILGTGPAGIGAAYELARAGKTDVIAIDRNRQIGGLARTEEFAGARFDVGPHRFFTKNEEINRLWHEVLGTDFRPVRRLTRIYYADRLFLYPISALDALPKLGPVNAAHALLSYFWAALTRDASRAETFEEWVQAKFGTKLYESFFKTYTEKVWGIPCAEIGAEWAAQRIKGLDLFEVAKAAVGVAFQRPKTLVDEFDYPSLGAGMMYERMAERASEAGVRFLLEREVTGLERRDRRITGALLSDGTRIEADQFVSTLPITRLLAMVAPPLETDVLEACEALYYRDHITVNLLVDRADLFPDQWIYVHAPDVQMARLANYRNFSDRMAPRSGTSPISIEYFAYRAGPLWKMTDRDLIALATEEIERMRLIPKGSAHQGAVIRETDSYPTYYLGFEDKFERVRAAIDRFENLAPAGRGGLYKYNNMDHSMLSGILQARNLIAADRRYNVWLINIDAEYHESAKRSS